MKQTFGLVFSIHLRRQTGRFLLPAKKRDGSTRLPLRRLCMLPFALRPLDCCDLTCMIPEMRSARLRFIFRVPGSVTRWMRSMLEPRQLQEQLRAFFGKPRHTGYVTPNGNSHHQRLIVWFSREVATGVHLSRGAETRGEPSGALARVGEIVRAGLTTRVPHHLLGRPNLQLSRLKNGEAYRDC